MKKICLKTLFFAFVALMSPLVDKELKAQEIVKRCDCRVQITRSFEDPWQVCSKLYEYILEILPEGSTMLELGSGWSSGEFSKHYTVWSIEHNEKWLNKYDTHYIYAPLVDGWYSVEALKSKLPDSYALILVDGPPSTRNSGRGKFFDNLHLFRTDVPIIFDDVEREQEYTLMLNVATRLQRVPQIISCGQKKFGVLLPKEHIDTLKS